MIPNQELLQVTIGFLTPIAYLFISNAHSPKLSSSFHQKRQYLDLLATLVELNRYFLCSVFNGSLIFEDFVFSLNLDLLI